MNLIYKIAVLFLISSALYSQQPFWKVVTKMPYPVTGGQISFNNSLTSPKFYVLGGYSDSLQKSVDWIQEYDINSGRWSMVGKMNVERSYFVAGIWDSLLVYFGGADAKSVNNKSLELWNFKSLTPPVFYDTNDYFNRTYSTGHVSNNYLYIIGGNDLTVTGILPYIIEYDLKNKKQTYSFNFPSSEIPQDHMSFMLNDMIYLFGGSFRGIKNWIFTFSTTNKGFVTRNETLLYRRAGGAAIYNPTLKRGYLLGGYDEINNSLSTVEEIEIKFNGEIKILSGLNMLYPRKYPMVINYGSNIVVFGGLDADNKVVREVEMLINPAVTAAPDEAAIPTEFSLAQNYPNPFNPTTNLKFGLPIESNVKLRIYNLLGEVVATLINDVMPAGFHTVSFDASNLSSGIYIYRIEAGDFTSTKKMVLMR